MNILSFLLGMLVGGTVGVVVMCIMTVASDRKN